MPRYDRLTNDAKEGRHPVPYVVDKCLSHEPNDAHIRINVRSLCRRDVESCADKLNIIFRKAKIRPAWKLVKLGDRGKCLCVPLACVWD